MSIFVLLSWLSIPKLHCFTCSCHICILLSGFNLVPQSCWVKCLSCLCLCNLESRILTILNSARIVHITIVRINSSMVLSLLPMWVQAMHMYLLSVPGRSLLVFTSQLFSPSSPWWFGIDHVSRVIRIRDLINHRLLMLNLVLTLQNVSLVPSILWRFISILQCHSWYLLMCHKLDLLLILLEKIVLLLL